MYFLKTPLQKVAVFCLSLLIFVLSLVTQAQDIPYNWEYRKLKTQHFDLIYAAKQKDLAPLFAESLEKVHQQVSHWFSELPERIVVVIQDKTDRTNGYATQLPYPHIVIFPVPPLPSDSLGELGEWNMTLIGHEYTHIATFTPANGIMKAFRVVFGNVIAPNLFLPNWWKEGIAVDVESQIAGRGRSHSIYQEAMLRSYGANLENFTIAEANENLPTWPEGHRPYFLGSLFWSYVTEQQGRSTHDLLTQRHGRRVPYFIETPAQDYLNTDYESFFKAALHSYGERAEAQTRELYKLEPTKETFILPKKQYSQYPSLNSTGDLLAVLATDDTDKRQIQILERKSDTEFVLSKKYHQTEADYETRTEPMKDAPPSGSISRISWLHNSNTLIYDKVTDFSYTESYSDLYRYDLSTLKTERLTFGARAREASADPEDKRLAFVQLSASQTALSILDLRSKSTIQIWQAPFEERISHPMFLDESKVIFSWTKKSGEEFLAVIDVDQKAEPQIILPEMQPARFPLVTKEALYFNSGKNRVWNIYKSDLSFKNVKALSHSTTSLFHFAKLQNSKSLIATSLTEAGPQVVSFEAFERAPSELPIPTAILGEKYASAKGELPKLELNKSDWLDSDYDSKEYLWPQYWIPFLASNTSGGLILQAITSGFDPLKRHQYSAQLNWDTQLSKASFQGSYTNAQFPWLWSIAGLQNNSYLGSTANSYTDTSWIFSLYPDLFSVNDKLRLNVGWRYFGRKYDTGETRRTGPSMILSHTDFSKSGTQVSPEEGHVYYFGYTQYLKTQDYLDHSQVLAGATVYLNKYLPARHAVMVKAQAFMIPESISALYGAQTDALNLVQDNIQTIYLLRGYKIGQVFGRNLYSSNIEYRFPVLDLNRGRGTDPYFFRRIFGAVTMDSAVTDGYVLNSSDLYQKTDTNYWYQSFGVEAHLETTLGYVVPLNFVIGVYKPAPDLNKVGVATSWSLQFSQLF